MLLTHNVYSMTIGRFSEMMESGSLHYMKKINIPLPKFYLKKRQKKLITEFNFINAKEEVQRLVNKDLSKLVILTKVNIQGQIILSMYKIYLNTGKDEVIEKQLRETIGLLTQRKVVDLEKEMFDFIRNVKQQTNRFEQVFNDPEEKKTSFEQNLINIEMILAPIDLRNKKLYTFGRYVKMAMEKLKQMQDGRNSKFSQS